jgi:hypothetical protein
VSSGDSVTVTRCASQLIALGIAGWSIARGLGAIVGPTIGATLYRPTPSDGTRSWGSAGSPGLVSLVAVSLAASAVVGIVVARIPDVAGLWHRLLERLSGQPSSSNDSRETISDGTNGNEYEMKPIQGEWTCLSFRSM